jgi:hypothetical protein
VHRRGIARAHPRAGHLHEMIGFIRSRVVHPSRRDAVRIRGAGEDVRPVEMVRPGESPAEVARLMFCTK